MKGTISEMELSTLRERCQAGLEHKARRGALFTLVPIGFVRAEGDRLEQDPDQRVREAIALVFRRFRELGTVRQVLMWLRQERIELRRTALPRADGTRCGNCRSTTPCSRF